MFGTFVLFAGACLVASAFLSCSGGNDNGKTSKSGNPSSQGMAAQAPATATKFAFSAYDLTGTLRHSDEWVGKQPVVLNFWGTWCPPCRKEIPDLVRIYNEFRPKGIEILGLAVNDSPRKVAEFSRQHGMKWVMLLADNSVAARYRISGVPTTIFIDRSGKEIGRFVGPRHYETFKKAFEAVLKS